MTRHDFDLFFHLQAKDWTKIIKVLLLNQPFSQSLTLKKKTFSSEFFYGPSFFHEETKNRENLHVMKKNIISVQLCLVRCEKIQNRDSPESKKKSPGTLPSKKSTSLAFPAWKIKALCKNGSFRWRIYDLPTNFMNEKCKPDRKRKIQEKMYSFLCCTFFTLTNKYPPQYRKTKQKKIPLSLRKRNLIINPMIKVIDSGEPNLDFKNNNTALPILPLFRAKRDS